MECFVKRGTVQASSPRADGTIELSSGPLRWVSSPRSLALCYERSPSQEGHFVAKARRVFARRVVEENEEYATLGGSRLRAPRGAWLLAWSAEATDCWALDDDVFRSRYVADGETEAVKEPLPNPVALSVPAPGGGCAFGAASLQGKRDENEDAHLAVPVWRAALGLFGVFDGHGGDTASSYCAAKLAGLIGGDGGLPTEQDLVDAFVALDRKYLKKNNDDGSTALLAVVDGGAERRLLVANAGDSRALLVAADGTAQELSRDHKPAVPAEKKRIEAAGFRVTVDTLVMHGKRVKVPRVDGKLAVSRAIGDDTWKDTDEEPDTWAVTSVPEVRAVQYAPGDVLVLACDGLFDVCSNAQVASFVAKRRDDALEDVAQQLAEEAIKNGSDDNVTVLVVRL